MVAQMPPQTVFGVTVSEMHHVDHSAPKLGNRWISYQPTHSQFMVPFTIQCFPSGQPNPTHPNGQKNCGATALDPSMLDTLTICCTGAA